eukprot:TRINITY_DN17312_c0_g1_i1.p1 TRINITY_DN17312_c0_g1~~TRINITY_DN17312_c0_g1_i1.p1  ORF type:complete len:184 (-),score=28.94 TRINITY_DN17312_c0_g1_i1:21-572(-)
MSFLYNWFLSVLYRLGLFKKTGTVLLLGLDNAGKTTLLHKLKNGTFSLFIPTQRALLEQIDIGNLKLKAWDLGGHELVRDLWKEYFTSADAIIFVIDSADTDRLNEAKEELHCLLDDEQINDNCPFLVLANKTDLKGSLNREKLISSLQLNEAINSGFVELFRCSLVNGTGYVEAFKWLSNKL